MALGLSYRDGVGVPQDYAEAYFWYNLAARELDALGIMEQSIHHPQDANGTAYRRRWATGIFLVLRTPQSRSRARRRARKNSDGVHSTYFGSGAVLFSTGLDSELEPRKLYA
jgi:TPR repeat protein